MRKLRIASDANAELPVAAEREERPANADDGEEEQGMGDDELTAYYNRYVALVNDHQQQTNIFTEEQLKKFIAELFRSLEYEVGEADGMSHIRSTGYFSFLPFRSTGVHLVSDLLRRGSTSGEDESKSNLFCERVGWRKQEDLYFEAKKSFRLFD